MALVHASPCIRVALTYEIRNVKLLVAIYRKYLLDFPTESFKNPVQYITHTGFWIVPNIFGTRLALMKMIIRIV